MSGGSKDKKIKGFRSLTVTLSAIFLLITLVILLIASGLEIYLSFKIQKKAVFDQEKLIAQEAADAVKGFIEEKISLLKVASRLDYLDPLLGTSSNSYCTDSSSQVTPSLGKLLSAETAFRQLVLFDSKKIELSRASRVSETTSGGLIQFDIDEIFTNLKKNGEYVGSVYIDKISNEPIIVLAAPVENIFGDIEGAVIAEVNLKFMWDFVSQLKIGVNGLAYVVNREGNLIAFNDISRILKEENLSSIGKVSEFVKDGKENEENFFIYSKGILGTNVVSDYVSIGTPDWAVVVELPATEAYAGVIYQLEFTILVVILIIILGTGFSFYLSKILTEPIINLRNAAEEISKGRFDVRAEIKSKDEIGELASDFNNMAKEIKIRTQELSEGLGRLKSLVESVRLGVIMVDLSLNIILANSAAKRILGKSPSQNLTFKHLSEKIKGSIDISQALSFYVKNGKSLNIQEAVIGERYFRFFMSPVRDVVDKIFIGAVVIIEDITEEKRLDKMRTEIVSITSHQLRTPSTIIKGNLDMLLDGDIGGITPEQKDVLNDVYMGNERMIRLINDLMDAAKIEEGKFKLTIETARLEDVVADVIEEMLPLAKSKKVELLYKKPAENLPEIKINVSRIKQVLQNLIVNAIQYSAIDDKGMVEVEISNEGRFLRFSVKDNGLGIPEDEQPKLFERFFRGSNITKLDPGGGSGLGLYIARAIIEQGGGKISFVSEENKGTIFNVTFPIN